MSNRWETLAGGPVRSSAKLPASSPSISGTLHEVASAVASAQKIGSTVDSFRKKDRTSWGSALGIIGASVAAVGALLGKASPLFSKMIDSSSERERRRDEQRLAALQAGSFNVNVRLCDSEKCVEGQRVLDNGRVTVRMRDGSTLKNCDQRDGKLSCAYEGRRLEES